MACSSDPDTPLSNAPEAVPANSAAESISDPESKSLTVAAPVTTTASESKLANAESSIPAAVSEPKSTVAPGPKPTTAPEPNSTAAPEPEPVIMQEPEPKQTSAPEPEPAAAPDGNNSSSHNIFNTYHNPEQQQTSATYVLNKNTKKIHHPNCSSVAKIAPKNYSTSDQSVEVLMSKGYTPCKINEMH